MRKGLVFLAVCFVLAMPPLASAHAEETTDNFWIFEAANGLSFGKFCAEDVTAEIDLSFFNPTIGAEYRFHDNQFGVGAAFLFNDDSFYGEWDGKDKRYYGDLDVERKLFDLYFRFIPVTWFNARAGYRYYNSDFKNGKLTKYEDGFKREDIYDATAEADLKAGLDLEINFIFGHKYQFRFGLGYDRFFSGDYSYQYKRKVYRKDGSVEKEETKSGAFSYDASGVRFIPEFGWMINDEWRLFGRYQLSMTLWNGETDDWDVEDYPGFEISSIFFIGVQYFMY